MSFSDWLLPDGAQTSGEAEDNYARLQERLRQQTDDRRAAGTLNQAQYDERQQILAQQLESQDRAAAAGFVEGAAEGFNNVIGFPQKATDKLFGAVPWQLWIVAAVVLFIWMGGLIMLRGRLAR